MDNQMLAQLLRQAGGSQSGGNVSSANKFDPQLVSSLGTTNPLAAVVRGGDAYMQARQRQQQAAQQPVQAGQGAMAMPTQQVAAQQPQGGGQGAWGGVSKELGGALGTAAGSMVGGPIGGAIGGVLGKRLGPMAEDGIKSLFNLF